MNRDILLAILDKARWAPSGDNRQSWRFELIDNRTVRVHCIDLRAHDVYDRDGHPSQLAFGVLLETMAIAATGHGLRAHSRRDEASGTDAPVFDVTFTPDPGMVPSPLIDAIETRAVQRRKMSTRPLTNEQKRVLEASVGPGYRLRWMESFAERRRAAVLMFRNANIRLLMPEAFDIHRSIIDWGKQYSPDKVPDQALGMDKMTLKMLRWAMHSWQRVSRINSVLGTGGTRMQLDLLPGIYCAAHFVLYADSEPQTIDDYVEAGRSVQRFWLSLTRLGLFMQPELTPLIFTRYVRTGLVFTKDEKVAKMAEELAEQTTALLGNNTFPVYIGRVGTGPAPTARSMRKPLLELMR